MTLLEILNNVLMQSSFLPKDSFAANADPDDQQMMAIANRVAYEIFNWYDWGIIRNVAVLDLVVGQNSYPVPADYQSIIPDSAWETDGSRKVDIPTSDAMWYQYKFSSLTTAGTIRARFYGDRIEINEPFAGGSFTYEYISKYPIRAGFDVGIPAAAEAEWSIPPASPASEIGSYWDTDYWAVVGARKEFFTADSDTWLLDDILLTLGIQAHWQQAKQMPSYAEHMMNYRTKMAEAIGRSNAAQTLGGTTGRMRRDPYTKLWVS